MTVAVPVVAGAIAAVGVPTALATIAANVIVGAATAYASFALQRAFAPDVNADQPSFAPSASPANNSRALTTQQAIPARRLVYGETRTGGALFFRDNANPHLYVGTAISDGQIESVDAVYVGDTLVPINADGTGATGSPYDGKYILEWSRGGDNQPASPLLVAAFDTVDETFRQRGVARAVSRLDFGVDVTENQLLWGSGTTPSYQVRGLRVFDPRDAAQSIGDPTTWTYSNNAALCYAHALAHVWTEAISYSAINTDSLIVAANYCDANGFTVSGIVESGTDVGAQLTDMMGAFRAGLSFANGEYQIVVDDNVASVITFTEDDVVGEEFEFISGARQEERPNAAQAVHYEPAGATFTTTDVYVDTAALVEDNNVERVKTYRLPFTSDAETALKIAGRNTLQSRDGRALSVQVNDIGLKLRPFDVVRFDLESANFVSGLFRVMQIDAAPVGAALVLRGFDPVVYTSDENFIN